MVMPNNWNDRIGKINCRQDVGADTCVKLHLFKFSRRKFAWLIENVLWHGQFAHVVKKCGRFRSFDQSFISNAQTLSQTYCIYLDTSDMAMRDLILRVNGHC